MSHHSAIADPNDPNPSGPPEESEHRRRGRWRSCWPACFLGCLIPVLVVLWAVLGEFGFVNWPFDQPFKDLKIQIGPWSYPK